MAIRIGFIGAGRMAQTLCKGFINADLVRPGLVTAADRNWNTLELVAKRLGVNVTLNNSDVVDHSDIVYLTVKPQTLREVVKGVADYVDPDRHLFVSIAAGIRTDTIESLLPAGCRVIRVMSNTPALVHRGASMYTCGNEVSIEDSTLVKAHFSSVGYCEEIDEDMMDAVTGLSGNGPAYGYVAIESMADGGVKMGLPRALSMQLAAQSLLGAAQMVLQTGEHPGQLKDDVCSPGGTTITALHQLEQSGLRAAVMDAIETGTLRSVALNMELNGAKKKKKRVLVGSLDTTIAN